MIAGMCSIKYFKYLIRRLKYVNLGEHLQYEKNWINMDLDWLAIFKVDKLFLRFADGHFCGRQWCT